VRAALAWLYADARVKTAFVRRVDRVIGVSAGLLDIYRDAGRIGTRPSAVAHTLVRVDRTPGDATRERRAFRLPDDPVVLYVGKRSPGKGYGVFIEAARLAAAEAPGTCFVVAGDGEGPFDAGGADIRHLGALPHDEVEKLYRAADVVVQPAVWPEPFSRVPLEAAAAGKPVVATRVGGTPEAVHDGVTGVLVERDDPKALADAIVGLLRDPATRDALGRSARAWVAERFGPAAIVRETLEAYRREEKP
jgi:glycosyltransferase involved in cell wall biosynthesis